MRHLRGWLTLLFALLMLGSVASIASGSGMYLERGGRIELSGLVRFFEEEEEFEQAGTCNITVSGSFMSGSITVAERTQTRVGAATSASGRGCLQQVTNFTFLGSSQGLLGAFWRNTPFPGWITREILITAFEYLLQVANVGSCLYRGSLVGYHESTALDVTITSFNVNGIMTKNSGPAGCRPFDTYSGNLTFTPAQRWVIW